MRIDDAMSHLVECLKGGTIASRGGYDFAMEDVLWEYMHRHQGFSTRSSTGKDDAHMAMLSPPFLDAAWELCRRGILRPGSREFAHTVMGAGRFADGFAITSFGRDWLSRVSEDQLAPLIPGRYGALLAQHGPRFGHGYLARGQQAATCYSALAFLACCAMCGAAAESIMLALAVEQSDSDSAIDLYARSGGRKKVRDVLVASKPGPIQRDFDGFVGLISYWRDESAHGLPSALGELEAFHALQTLLRFARYAADVFPSPKESER